MTTTHWSHQPIIYEMKQILIILFLTQTTQLFRLVCYLSPSDSELKSLQSKSPKADHNNSSSKKRHKKHNKEPDTKVFSVKTSDLDKLKLQKISIKSKDLELLPCSLELEWIVDLAVMSMFSYILTEIQFYYYPPSTNQYNFSLFWAALVIICSIRTLSKFTWLYFRMQELIGERSVCIISACLFLLISMVLLIVDESKLEFGIETAYRSFNTSASRYVMNHDYLSKPVSLIMIKFTLALCCTILGALFTFPGLRFGQMQGGLIESYEKKPVTLFVYHANYLNSLVILMLWIKPLTRDLLTDPNRASYTLSDENFDTFRIYYMIFACLFRFFLLPSYLNTYLKLVESKITTMKRSKDTMPNTSIQEMIAQIYSYINIVAIQYTLPIFMCLFSAIMFKNLGGYSWFFQLSHRTNHTSLANNFSVTYDRGSQILNPDSFIGSVDGDSEALTLSESSNFFGHDLAVDFNDFKNIFSPEVFRGLLGFCNWWLHFVWFCTSSIGLVYHTKFSASV